MRGKPTGVAGLFLGGQGQAELSGKQGSEISFTAKRRQRFLDKLYRDHWNDLTGWLMRRYGAGPPEPEDIAQAAYAKIAALEDIDHIENPRAFLFTTAVNTALQSIRWIGRTRQIIDRDLEILGFRVEEITPERVYSAKERFDSIMDCADVLSPKQKEIIRRSRIEGQTFERISSETGWSIADISRQLKKALVTLRDALDDEHVPADDPKTGRD